MSDPQVQLRTVCIGVCGTLQTAVEMGVPNAVAALDALRAANLAAIDGDKIVRDQQVQAFDALDDARAAMLKVLETTGADDPGQWAVVAAEMLSAHQQAKVLVERERSRIDGLR